MTDLHAPTRAPAGSRGPGRPHLPFGHAAGPNGPKRRPPVGWRIWRVWQDRPVLQFVTLGLLLMGALIAIACQFAERAALREAIADLRARSTLLERAVVRPEMPVGLASSDPAAVAAFDQVVHRQVLGGWLVRVKVWNEAGTIVYSDEPRLIGQHFGLDKEAEAAFAQGTLGGVEGGLSDLDEAENRYETSYHRLYEAYVLTEAPDGQRLLFEAYYRYSDLDDRGGQVLNGFLPTIIGGLVLFELLTIPLVWRLARRVRRGREERERLLLRAVEASDAERRRIAADLHDGVVQELAGASFALAAAAKSVPEAPAVSASLDRVAAGVRQSMRSLRSLLVEIYPPNLHTEGLAAALGDLLAPLPGSGLSTSLEVPDPIELAPETATLLFRVAQESVRNAQRHAAAHVIAVKVTLEGTRVVLTVTDDGTGFDTRAPAANGHVGLRLLADLATEAGGSFEVRSRHGHGTTVRLDMPL